MANTKVSVKKVNNNLELSVQKAMELAEWQKYIKKNKDIALKVNLGWDIFIPGSITSPSFVEGVIKVLYDYVGKIYIIEANQVLENIEKAYYRSNTYQLIKKYDKVEWVNLSNKKLITIKREDNSILKEVSVPQFLLDIDFITVPVMKTHGKSTISGALKNQWGCLPEFRHKYHLVLDKAIADINSIFLPKFSVIDGTIALEGNGPKNGIPKEMNLVLASNDPVAVDTVMAEIMGFDSTKIEHLSFASERGLGTNKLGQIEVVGSKIDDHKSNFIRAKHNLISKLEMLFRKSILKKLVFDTWIFSFALLFGKFYYRLWMRFSGRKIWKKMLLHPLYAQQWFNEYTEKFKK